MAIADTITSMQTHTTNAYNVLAYATDLTGVNKNLANLKQCIFDSLINSMSNTTNPTWNNLPKITTTAGTSQSINNTIEAPMRITLQPSELTQDSTPTPSSPQDIHTISGSNKIVVSDGNGNSQEADIDLGEIEYCKISTYEDKFIRTSGKNEYDINTNPLENSSTTRVRTTGYISLKAGTHTISYTGANKIYAVYYNSNNTKIGETNWTTGDLTFTFNQDYKYVFYFGKTGDATITASEVVNVMLNEGTTALPYEPYGSNEWYIKKAVPKIESYNGETITTTYMSTTGGLDTGATVYYGTNTPTYTKITGTLAEQLEAIYNAMSKNGQTNISQVNNDLPFVLNTGVLEAL